jgi:molybdate transport system regulatory protein
MPAPIVRFRIDFAENSNVGPGKIGLLEAIRAAGSLSQAARDIGMSYRRAWLLLESLQNSFSKPVTVASTGGKGGGGVELTAFGAALIDSYRALESDVAAAASRRLRTITPQVAAGSRSVKIRAVQGAGQAASSAASPTASSKPGQAAKRGASTGKSARRRLARKRGA